jgi:hypothetical protein
LTEPTAAMFLRYSGGVECPIAGVVGPTIDIAKKNEKNNRNREKEKKHKNTSTPTPNHPRNRKTGAELNKYPSIGKHEALETQKKK